MMIDRTVEVIKNRVQLPLPKLHTTQDRITHLFPFPKY